MTDNTAQTSHRRRNALTGEWVTVSPHRTERPWQGETSPATVESGVTYDPECYLCPGNARANGGQNAACAMGFDNDFRPGGRWIGPESVLRSPADGSEAVIASVRTHCRALPAASYHPEHQKPLPT